MNPDADILWFEDEEMVLKSTIPVFKKNNLRVQGVKNPHNGLNILETQDISLVLLDLRMPEMDGIKVIREIKSRKAEVPIVLLSAYIHDPEYKQRLDKKDIVDSIEKPIPMETAASFHEIIRRIQRPSNAFKARHFEPFTIPFHDYLTMEPDQTQLLQKRAQALHKPWIENQWRERKAKWMIVCDHTVLRASSTFDDYPTREELVEVGQTFGLIPFVFFVAPQSEESRWTSLRDAGDYYPTIQLNAAGKKQSICIIADFDTGNMTSLFDLELLENNKVVDIDYHFDFFHFNKHHEHEISYYVKKLLIELVDENNRKTVQNMPCYLVQNWGLSPFTEINPDRSGLVGRDVFKKFSIVVVLDGKNKRTKIYYD